jgi:hypothetical protein
MTPIMLERICKDIEANGAKLNKMIFVVGNGDHFSGTWHWMNQGQGGLDSTIVVNEGNRTYYLVIDSIAYIISPNGKKTKEA